MKKSFGKVGVGVEATMTYTYRSSGTYFPAIRVGSHRDGKVDTPYALTLNLGRGRVVVGK